MGSLAKNMPKKVDCKSSLSGSILDHLDRFKAQTCSKCSLDAIYNINFNKHKPKFLLWISPQELKKKNFQRNNFWMLRRCLWIRVGFNVLYRRFATLINSDRYNKAIDHILGNSQNLQKLLGCKVQSRKRKGGKMKKKKKKNENLGKDKSCGGFVHWWVPDGQLSEIQILKWCFPTIREPE